jgi:hypothetical protein
MIENVGTDFCDDGGERTHVAVAEIKLVSENVPDSSKISLVTRTTSGCLDRSDLEERPRCPSSRRTSSRFSIVPTSETNETKLFG